jgi:hypothetical protein
MQLREKKDQVRGKGFGSIARVWDTSLPVSLHNHIQYVVLFTTKTGAHLSLKK